jgi:lysophospholipase L1-like esterase
VKRLLQSLALAIASLLVLLLLLEAGVRLLVPASRWRFLDAAADWKLEPGIGWVNQPSLDVTSETAFGPVRFRTNPDGLIPAEATREKPAGSLRIMVFGDSMVVGRSLEQDRLYTARLEADLRARGIPADVVNAGVQGYSTDQALLLMQRWLPVYTPDVVLYGSTLNDYGGNSLDSAYQQAKPRFQLDGRQLRLTLPKLATEVHSFGEGPRRWLQNSALYRLIQPGIFLLRARLFGLEERILLGTEQGVFLGDGTIDKLDWALYEALVVRMQESAHKASARFLFFAHPEVGEVWEPYIESVCRNLGVPRSRYDPFAMERRLVALAERRGLEFVPTVQAFRDAAAGGPYHLVPIDAHMNAAGHALLAKLLAERLAGELPAQTRVDGAGASPATSRR